MSKKYTTHKLTDAQLRRLSRIVNDHPGARAGQAGAVLERKGLVERYGRYTHEVRATAAGRQALIQARVEGW